MKTLRIAVICGLMLLFAAGLYAEDVRSIEVIEIPDTPGTITADTQAAAAPAYGASLISQSPGTSSVTLLAGQVLNCTIVFDNVGQNSWLAPAGNGQVELRSTDSLGTQAVSSPLASGWNSSSSVKTVSGLVLAQFGPANAANSKSLSWTAPGDDDMVGTAAQYDLRFGTSPITIANWSTFLQVVTPTPQPARTLQSATVSGLTPSTTYYFCIRTADERPNWSPLSNLVQTSTASVRTTFSFNIVGPSTPGLRVQFFRLYANGTGYFGPVVRVVVQVNSVAVPMTPAFALILRDPATGEHWLRVSNGSSFMTPTSPNSPAELCLVAWPDSAGLTYTEYLGDLNGDGFKDLVAQRSDATWFVAWNNGNNTFTRQVAPILGPWGTGGTPGKYFFALADFFGDAKDELLTYDASNANWYVLNFNPSTNTFTPSGPVLSWGGGIGVFQPLIGDWDGSGKKDLCLRNWSTGQHWVRTSNGVNGFVQPPVDLWTTWGAVPSPDILQPFVGDWNGDGPDDLLLLNSTSGRWYVRTSTRSAFVYPAGSNNPADTWATWIGPGYLPFVGDLSNSGPTDIGLRNPVTGDHWVRLSNGLAFVQPSPDNWAPAFKPGANFQLITGRCGANPVATGPSSARAVAVLEPDQPSPTSFSLHCYPNPFQGQGQLQLEMPAAEQGRLELYDVAGRLIDRVIDQWFAPGVYTFAWTGRLGSGGALTNGLYLLRYSSAHRSVVTKVVVAR